MSQLEKKENKSKPIAREVSIKRTVVDEKDYSIVAGEISVKDLKKALDIGEFNLIQSATVEPYVDVVNANGQRIAILEKLGGMRDTKTKVSVK